MTTTTPGMTAGLAERIQTGFLAEIDAAQTAYSELTAAPSNTESRITAELIAASDLARLYTGLSAELTGPLAVALHHAHQYLEGQIADLDYRLDCDSDRDDAEPDGT